MRKRNYSARDELEPIPEESELAGSDLPEIVSNVDMESQAVTSQATPRKLG